MLKVRVIPTVLYNGSVMVKSIQFERHRNVGSPVNVVRVFNSREVDELVFLDITCTRNGHGPDLDVIGEIAAECFMPLTVGGGITTVEDITRVIRAGADKVSINSAARSRKNLITEGAIKFGSQAIVASIDAKATPNGYKVFDYLSGKANELSVTTWACELQQLGAGEILLNSVDNDGMMEGFDLELIAQVASAVTIPVIVCGGAGRLIDFAPALKQGASAISAASIFHFTQHTPMEVKREIKEAGFPARV
ncbi:MAG: imidazole glycerol phosphate synthase subunit HisF [Candidatus Obscuribacter sp.]|nr:imidazole glycerol phosphate synthase subunit HisF [Candidatus Obscuribacter sp.]